MAPTLLPFPRYRHLPFGTVVGALPVTRGGIRNLPATALPAISRHCFAHLEIRRHLNGDRCRGLCGLLHHTVFWNGTVRPHESTLRERLQRQERIVLSDGGALGKPILLTVPSLADWWPRQDARHQLSDDCLEVVGQDNNYRLRDYIPGPNVPGTEVPRAAGPQRGIALDASGPLVIADGHHRARTHARLGAAGHRGFEHLPVCLIGADELHIGVFARVVTAPDTDAMLNKLQTHFRVAPLAQPQAPRGAGEWLLTYRNKYYRLYRRVRRGDATDVDWLDNVVLPDACTITDVRSDDRIVFTPIDDPQDGLIASPLPPGSLCFVGFPLPKDRFFAEVAAGRMLPPKSTRFEPRMPSGLVVWEEDSYLHRRP